MNGSSRSDIANTAAHIGITDADAADARVMVRYTPAMVRYTSDMDWYTRAMVPYTSDMVRYTSETVRNTSGLDQRLVPVECDARAGDRNALS